ncbi:cyclic nucleotide-gated cation channel alpha-4 [Amblyraja radiata]|uniref:cyclic nucleotide-gated cation channel alpha-4 n=1 Tax=Amblyraja radiata TaxID=386614 RepID=UPI001402FF06|nr:cyclic nucleotide-gated cation channel alpha-4 [Amblyraja radiata]
MLLLRAAHLQRSPGAPPPGFAGEATGDSGLDAAAAVQSEEASEKLGWNHAAVGRAGAPAHSKGHNHLWDRRRSGQRPREASGQRQMMPDLDIGSPWILDPMGDAYYYWLIISSLPVAYNWIMLVARCSFTELHCRYLTIWLVLDYLSDFMYLLNMAVRLNTAVSTTGHLEQGVLVTARRPIGRRYLRSATFALELCSLVPAEVLGLAPGLGLVPGLGPVVCAPPPALRLNRLLQLSRARELRERAETRSAHPPLVRVSAAMGLLLLAIHWNACAYFALSSRLGLGSDAWVAPAAGATGLGLTRQYLHSVHFSTLVLATIGNTPAATRPEEYLFVVGDLLAALLLIAVVVGSVESAVRQAAKTRLGAYPDARGLRRLLGDARAPASLRERAARWCRHVSAYGRAVDEERVLLLLPERLRALLAAHVRAPALARVRLFGGSGASTSAGAGTSGGGGLLERLAPRLRPQALAPGDTVCRRGDVGRHMYLVRDGCLAVIGPDGLPIATLHAGSYFGEISVLHIPGNKSGNRRTATIQSVGYSDLLVLSKEDLAEVLQEFPEARQDLEEKGREMLRKMGMLEEGEAFPVEVDREGLLKKAERLDKALDSLRTSLARLIGERQSALHKMKLRLRRLERWLDTHKEAGPVAPGQGQGQAKALVHGQPQDQAQEPEPEQAQASVHGQTQAPAKKRTWNQLKALVLGHREIQTQALVEDPGQP